MGQDALHLARPDHARFVDDKHIARGQKVAPLRPAMFHASNGARCNGRPGFEILRCNTRQRRAANFVTRCFPSLARNAQHRRLAGSGIANDYIQVLWRGNMIERCALLACKQQPACFRRCQGAIFLAFADFVQLQLCH